MKDEVKEDIKELEDLISEAEKKAGNKDIDVDSVLNILNALNVSLAKQKVTKKDVNHKELIANVSDISKQIKDEDENTQQLLKSLIQQVKDNQPKEFPKELDVTVTNQQEFPEEIKVTNQPKYPTSFDVKKPKWWKEFDYKLFNEIVLNASQIQSRVKIEGPLDPKTPIPVRLSDGKKFYNAMMSIASSGSAFPFNNASGNAIAGLVDNDGHLQVDVLSSSVITIAGSVGTVYQFNLANSDPIGVGITDFNGNMMADFPVNNTSIDGPGKPTIDSYQQIAINLNAGADQLLVSSAASKQIWVYAITYTCSVAGTVSFQDEDDTAITGIMDHAANSGLVSPPSGNFAMPVWKLATNKDLEVDVVSASIDGWLSYAIVSV